MSAHMQRYLFILLLVASSQHHQSPPPILVGQNAQTQWLSTGQKPWADFSLFWSNPDNGKLLQREYPFVLDLKISPVVRNQVLPLRDLVTEILVTQFYAQTYERIKSGLRLDRAVLNDEQAIERPPAERDGVIITGQPGTGTLFPC